MVGIKGVVEEKGLNIYGDGLAWFRGSMIGKGAFGSVYLATLKNPRSKYSYYPSMMAVKSAEVSSSGSIQKEREVLSNLYGCADIIKCFGEETTIGENGLMAFNLLLEYGSGGTLADRIKKSGGRGLPEFEARVYTRSILRGLNHVHGSGYVHCDLKPDNVLLVSNSGRSCSITEFRAKIGDFGLAKRAEQSKKRRLEAYWRGTPMYLSPEAVIDKVQEPPCDVWALGCIVLEMLTGKSPWNGEKSDEILEKIGVGRELPHIPGEVSNEARGFLKGCLVRNSSFRFTAEMLLHHPFVEGLEDDDSIEELEEDFNETEFILSVSECDDEFSSGSYCSWSNEDADNEVDENISSFEEEGEVKEEEIGGVWIGTSSDESNEKQKHILSPKSRQQFPVSFNIPAGI
ncbi:hypothetical protein RD792_008471 [Penstemon davidsonii]|uniref:Protein kinase domain-containing protein n=1 Tax=Penstemon davidsonii TaxID=160366 RepID=A0ABR0D990_9LAMI|nr:hypothetical protein RD792_008471 [Penstemon davidsonii]